MAVQGPWVGSSAVAETGQRWMSTARTVVRLPAAGWMSEMNGRSKEIELVITENHNYQAQWLIDWLRSIGSTPGKIIIAGHIVSPATTQPVLDFPSDLPNAYVHIVVNPGVHVLGRGGNGRGQWEKGDPGGNAIHNWIGGRLQITNNGVIGGGGGGGGSAYDRYSACHRWASGSGGRPYGAGGGAWAPGKAADFWNPGGESNAHGAYGGAGGNLGAAGAAGRFTTGGKGAQCESAATAGGAAGLAVLGGGTTWHAWGQVYGTVQ
ncbi:tail fiber protein [Citrobacter phage Ci1]|nr:tail fiber protein [Citrobacter phage Ci1]